MERWLEMTEPRERYPSGKLKPANDEWPYALTPEALHRRADELGIDPIALIKDRVALTRVCMDPDAGTALGRLAYVFDDNGNAEPRLGWFTNPPTRGMTLQPFISEDMIAAANAYRILWATYHRQSGLPARNPRGQQFERRSPSKPIDAPLTKEQFAELTRVVERMQAASDALRRSRWPSTVQNVVDRVVIADDDIVPRDEDSLLLLALREGLDALHRVLCTSQGAKAFPAPATAQEAA